MTQNRVPAAVATPTCCHPRGAPTRRHRFAGDGTPPCRALARTAPRHPRRRLDGTRQSQHLTCSLPLLLCPACSPVTPLHPSLHCPLEHFWFLPRKRRRVHPSPAPSARRPRKGFPPCASLVKADFEVRHSWIDAALQLLGYHCFAAAQGWCAELSWRGLVEGQGKSRRAERSGVWFN